MSAPPFESALAVDMDLCYTGVAHAAAKFFEVRGAYASVLWVAPADLQFADQMLDTLRSTIVAIPDPEYVNGAWSVGTRRDRGFGSVGS